MKSVRPVTMHVDRAKELYGDLVATSFMVKRDELAWSVLAGLPETFSSLRTILETSESAINLVDAILPKLLLLSKGLRISLKERAANVMSVSGLRQPDLVSKLSVVVPMKQKSEVFKAKKHVIDRPSSPIAKGKKLRPTRTDRGKEYVSRGLKDVFGGKGTVHEKTAPYTASRTEWLGGSFGNRRRRARSYKHVPKQRRRKLEPVSEHCVFVGYEADFKAYRVLREKDERIMISRNVIFDEAAEDNGV
ncbi:hypothetical protein KFL_011000010 [Klebsormidium nitens]|uniref:Retroviral polymerase SH3-like domain-containing protein n=1 Tax=Klebsormidium nitens TaxID=105231 RepID=A0A1Y1IPS8_KLENI|nr:hypothetical protein KFL_011000010 [Klebsormidium nitens]|eukprot:GAQ92704.1 hypothetical protein KFL_011000010 [Klebsormidium nitens]